jgi:catechol 1,2-dioxygenase
MDFTERVLNAYSIIENSRLKFVVSQLIKHAHVSIKEMRPTDQEFEFAWYFMERMAAKTGPERNGFY